jgi:GMP synthase (glutamine-hydrolysing)
LIIDQPPDPLFAGLPSRLKVWMSHGDSVQAMPGGFKCLAATKDAPLAACSDSARGIYGLQFHPEVAHTERGRDILANWLFRICQCRGTWQPAAVITRSVEDVRDKVGDQQAICALSGGVDSTVAATLVKRAIGDRLTCVFVDHGLLRQGEADGSLAMFRQLGLRVVHVDAAERFLEALRGVVDPEDKRRVIGREFIRVFEGEARRLGIGADQGNTDQYPFLVQGTLYPDVIESSAADTQEAARIKTHHNVGGLPQDMKLRLIEPLRYLFKDEVRRIGVELGLPEEAVYRQPFPGPGLAVRLIGPVTRERLDVLRSADAVVTEEVAAAGLSREVWQYFAVLTPVRSVGVMGDDRSYANVVAVRAVVSTDGMTADWARLPPELLEKISSRIVNEVPGVNRVVYDITSKPPSTIEWE